MLLSAQKRAGYASSRSTSQYPRLWDGLFNAYVPAIGYSNGKILDLGYGGYDLTLQGDAFVNTRGNLELGGAATSDKADNTSYYAINNEKFISVVCRWRRVGPDHDNEGNLLLFQVNTTNYYWLKYRQTSAPLYRHECGYHDGAWRINDYVHQDSEPSKWTVTANVLNHHYPRSELWHDGGLKSSANGTGTLTGTINNIEIGKWFHGEISAVYVYTRALQASDFKVLQADMLAPFRQRVRSYVINWDNPTLECNNLLTNLISYWKLDEASGAAALDAHGSNDLTVNTSPGTDASGLINSARDFEADSGQYFNENSNSDFQTGNIDFSLSLWVKLESLGAGSDLFIIEKGNEYHLMYDNSENDFQFGVKTRGTTVTSTVGVSINTWYHIVVYHDSVNDEIGIVVNDGTPVTTAESVGPSTDSTAFYMGADNAGQEPFDGLIDEVGYWKKVLSADEISCLYNYGNGKPYEDFTPSAGQFLVLPF